MREATIKIAGMTCGGCVKAVTTALSRVAGVKVLSVTVGEARVSLGDSEESLESLRAPIEDAGFDVVSLTPGAV